MPTAAATYSTASMKVACCSGSSVTSSMPGVPRTTVQPSWPTPSTTSSVSSGRRTSSGQDDAVVGADTQQHGGHRAWVQVVGRDGIGLGPVEGDRVLLGAAVVEGGADELVAGQQRGAVDRRAEAVEADRDDGDPLAVLVDELHRADDGAGGVDAGRDDVADAVLHPQVGELTGAEEAGPVVGDLELDHGLAVLEGGAEVDVGGVDLEDPGGGGTSGVGHATTLRGRGRGAPRRAPPTVGVGRRCAPMGRWPSRTRSNPMPRSWWPSSASACHGLRNPLAIATGMLDLLERIAGDQLDEWPRDLLGRSAVAVRRTADMVLSIQRHVGARHRPLQQVSVDLGEAVAWVSEAFDPAEVVVEVERELPMIVADRDMVEWVFHELFENARRHRDRPEPVTVVVDAAQADGRWIVAVTDDGSGIPSGRHDEAFGEGAVLDRSGGGLGVGLAIVRAVMARHGGEAHLEDAPGAACVPSSTWPT